MGACLEVTPVNERRMLSNSIFNKIFHFPAKKLIRNVFWDTQEGLEFQTLSKYVFYLISTDMTFSGRYQYRYSGNF